MTRSALRWSIPVLLGLQLAMLWLQGAQLHRQNQVLQGLREDIQALADSIESGAGTTSYEDDASAVPASFLKPSQKKVAVLGVQEEQEAAAKELQASRESAQKAVKEAREAQSKLSIEENARKAEEAGKVQATASSSQRWAWIALGALAVVLVLRALLRRRR